MKNVLLCRTRFYDYILQMNMRNTWEKFSRGEGVDLLDVAHIPMVMHPMNTGISQLIKQYYIENHCTFKLFGEGATQEIVTVL